MEEYLRIAVRLLLAALLLQQLGWVDTKQYWQQATGYLSGQQRGNSELTEGTEQAPEGTKPGTEAGE